MTFEGAAWAIDGARIPARVARIAEYAATLGATGIVRGGDLKVRPLTIPGQGIIISGGSALIPNLYNDGAGETYAVLNKGDHTMQADEMPPASSSVQHYIVAITVGDPEFSQIGHPWMGSGDPPAGQESTFRYVRPAIIPVAAGATRLPSDIQYPALPLARLEVPADTTTITASMIKDLRKMAQVRRQQEIVHMATTGLNQDIGKNAAGTNMPIGVRHRFPDRTVAQIEIPSWANTIKVLGFVEGLRLPNDRSGAAGLRVAVGNATGAALIATGETNVNEQNTSGFQRRTYTIGGSMEVPTALRGTIRHFFVEANIVSDTYRGFLATDEYSGVMLQVTFEENTV